MFIHKCLIVHAITDLKKMFIQIISFVIIVSFIQDFFVPIPIVRVLAPVNSSWLRHSFKARIGHIYTVHDYDGDNEEITHAICNVKLYW